MNKEQKNAKREYLERIEGQTLDECRSLLRKGLWTEGEDFKISFPSPEEA